MKDLVWGNRGLLCDHPSFTVYNPPLSHNDDDRFYVPRFNFSLITDPTDPLFEDVIKVKRFSRIYLIYFRIYFVLKNKIKINKINFPNLFNLKEKHMYVFSYSCKTKLENGFSHLISETV